MCRKFMLAMLAVCAAAVMPARAAVSVEGRKLLVDGSLYTIKGVCYQPIPVGYNNTLKLYEWWNNEALYTGDLALLKAMGVNTLRLYNAVNMTAGFMDAVAAQDMKIVMGYYVDDTKIDPPDTAMMDGFVSMINTWKNHPAVLMWMFGNEVIDPLTASHSKKVAWYTCLSSACARAHAADTAHPVGTVHRGVGDIGNAVVFADTSSLAALDIWGINEYRGKSFGNTFNVMAASTTKPYFLSEWGCDAFNTGLSAEDERTQFDYVSAQWAEIAANLTAGAKNCSGGTVFEWSDEWWKNFNTSGADDPFHDIVADWTNAEYSDPGMQEEWWGMVAITSGTTTRRLRLSYFALQDAWNPAAPSTSTFYSTVIIQGAVHSYPNPFRAGADAATIKVTVHGAPEITAEVFDLTGRKICSLRDITVSGDQRLIRWRGADSNGDTVPAGLYVCKITAKAGSREETKFRKIAVIQ